MRDDIKVLTLEETKDCPFCGSSGVTGRKTGFAVGISSGGVTRARPGTYRACDYCGVVFLTGDVLLTVDGKQYLLHVPHGIGCDRLAGTLVTGPWGTALEPSELPGDRVILESDDMPRGTEDVPLEHIEEIAAMIRTRRPGQPIATTDP